MIWLACAGGPAPAPADLVEAAIRARGGSLDSFTRTSGLLVHYGFPGRWRWEIAFHRPDRFRLALQTTGDEQSFSSDGETLRTYLGSALVAEEPAGGACSRSLARWLAVVTLDELRGRRYRWRRGDLADAPPGAIHAIDAVCRGEDADYRLWLDRDLRLIAAAGPIALPNLAAGRLAARFSDFRDVDGVEVPFRIDYRLDGQRFVEESVEAFQRGAPGLDPAASARTRLR